jgi:hypothetical protein
MAALGEAHFNGEGLALLGIDQVHQLYWDGRRLVVRRELVLTRTQLLLLLLSSLQHQQLASRSGRNPSPPRSLDKRSLGHSHRIFRPERSHRDLGPIRSAGVVRLTSLTALTDSCESRFEGLQQTH